MQPCIHEKTIDIINDKVDRLDNRTTRIEDKLDTVIAYQNQLKGGGKAATLIGSIVGALFGYVMSVLTFINKGQ